MDYNKFIEHRINFLYKFLGSGRPASELDDFMKAFDIIVPKDYVNTAYRQCSDVTTDTPEIKAEETIGEETLGDETVSTVEKRKRGRPRKTIVLNDGTKLNINPASKIVKVSFLNKESYYESVTAAAKALGVSYPDVSKALKKGHLVNGHSVEFGSVNDLMKASKKE